MTALAAAPALTLRVLEPGDVGHLAALFDRLSEQSRYLRYLAPVHRLPPGLLDYLAAVDHVAHEAVGVFDAGDLVGVAHYFRSAVEPWAADVSVEVADTHQRRGLGAWLVDELTRLGRARGVTELRATALRENAGVRALVRRWGSAPVIRADGPELQIAIPLGPVGQSARTEGGTGMPARRSGAGSGSENTVRIGTTPAQASPATSSGSSSGHLSETRSDQVSSGSASTSVAASSRLVDARTSADRPGTRCSTRTSRATRFASPSSTVNCPNTTALR